MKRLLYGGLAALGLAVYLWPAFAAPVVLWSDSALDLDWARRGEGILTPVVSPHHPPKPGYLLFLRAVLAAGPADGAEHRIVVVQSVLLWLGIAAAAVLVGRRLGPRYGLAIYVVLILALRLRDASSAVMSEALAAALLLPIAAVLLDPPSRASRSALLGISAAALFLVRPNAGAAALLLASVSLAAVGRVRQLAPLALGFALLCAPFWLATRVPGDPFRGMAPAFLTGSSDYGWAPQHDHFVAEPPPFLQVRAALAGWRATFHEPDGDRNRQLIWRALHGLLGTDFYDARWSPAYNRLTSLARVLGPLWILASIAVLLAASLRRPARLAKLLGLLLLSLLVAQSLVLGALARLALPFLPALLLFGVAALPGLIDARRRIAAAAVFALLVAFTASQRQVLDWEWGRVEEAGVRLRLAIPRGSLPDRAPATLHVRIAPLVQPTAAGLEIRGEDGERLFASDPGAAPSPFLSVALPESVLRADRERDVVLTLLSVGGYDSAHFLIFPVIPPPWGPAASREGSAELSPATGIGRGSLDWWAHAGAP